MNAGTTTVVLVHGAWHRPRPTWSAVIDRLTAAGIAAIAVDLPSCRDAANRSAGLDDDVAAVRDAIDSTSGPVVLCGHSYGGVVVSVAGLHPQVEHLVYLAAFCLDAGETVYDMAATDPPPPIAHALRFHDDGTMTIDPRLARDVFYADVDDAAASVAVDALVASTAVIFATPQPAGPAWRSTAATYIRCELDRAVPLASQDTMAARCTSVHSFASSHSPFLSRPDDVAAILARLACR